MGKKPFINRKTAKHYQLVHRSQRDPLINDADAPSRVLVEVPPPNLRGKIDKSGRSLSDDGQQKDQDYIDDSRRSLSDDEGQQKDQAHIESRVGQAALYGIYYDDLEYDYLQHLKPIGAGENGGSVFIEASSKNDEKKKQEKKKGGNLSFVKDEEQINQESESSKKERKVSIVLPEEVLPSKEEIPINYLDRSYIPDDLQGFQPDLDPNLREVLEALEDEAYVENNLNDDYFAALNAEGEFDEEEEEEEEGDNWEIQFNKYKKTKKGLKSADDDHEEDSDLYEDDRRSKATGYSMTSSVMYRNDKLRLLDDQFEKFEKEYMSDGSSESDNDSVSSSQIRQDFSHILDEFIEKYEVTRHSVFRKGPVVNILEQEEENHQQLRDQDKADNATDHKKSSKPNKGEEELVEIESEPSVRKRQPWDCQSILSTYSNLENHPTLIREKPRRKIEINKHTGLPIQEQEPDEEKPSNSEKGVNDEKSTEIEIEEDEDGRIRVNLGEARSKTETKEEKKKRKENIKNERRNRRFEKKSLKKAFAKEHMNQAKISHNLQTNFVGAIHLE